MKRMGHNQHWDNYKIMQLHPDKRALEIPRDYYYYYNCDQMHPGRTCFQHGITKFVLIFLAYSRLFGMVRLIPGLVKLIYKNVTKYFSKDTSEQGQKK